MSDDQCQATTADDAPCQNPAGENGYCWIPSHNPDDDRENPQGRPTKFTDDRARNAIHAAKQSKSKAGCARAAGVSKQTILDWEDANPTFTNEAGETQEFLDAFTRARADGETLLIQGGLRDDNVDSSMAKFLLASSFDYVKAEKREHEHAGEDGGPLEINVTETVVESEWEPPEE